MAFLLRTVSHSAEGREIVRGSRIEGDRLTIGRSPGCNVHLTDLAVALQHAVVERTGPDRMYVAAEEGLWLELNGRKLRSGTIELGTGGDIRIASHLLRVMPTPAGAEEIAIDVERVTEGEVKLDQSAERRFSLASVMPGKRLLAWLLALIVLGIAIAWPVYDRERREARAGSFHADEMWSSGRLSLAHAQLEGDCTACHVRPFEAIRDESCKTCHAQVHDHADPFRMARAQPDLGRWARIELAFKETFNIPPGRCVDCHTEHEGPTRMPVTEQRFCSDCHATLKSKLPDTRIADAGDFGTSHPEFAPALLTQWNGDRPQLQRVSLSANPREMSNLKFPHDLHLNTSGGVAQMARRLGADHGFGGKGLACKDCHDPTPDGVRFQPVSMEEDCAMCHSLAFDRQGGTLRTLRHGEPAQVIADLRDFYRARTPRPPATIAPMARRRPGQVTDVRNRVQFASGGMTPSRADAAIRAVFSPGGACFDCHQVQAPPAGSLAYKIRPVAFPVRYMHHGWFDHRPHATTSCSTCHVAEKSNASSDLLLPGIATCRECHGGEDAARKVQSSCASCHDYHMDAGEPVMLIRQRVRGRKRVDTPVDTAARQ